MGDKVCVECKKIKNTEFFGRDKNSKDGFARRCKTCQNTHSKEYRDRNLESIKVKSVTRYQNNKEKILTKQKEVRDKNKDEISKRRKKHYKENTEIYKARRIKNKDNIKAAKKKYIANNKHKIKEYAIKVKDRRNKQKVEHRKQNPHKRIQHCLQTRIRTAINSVNGKKLNHTEELIGCSALFYKEYLESKFTIGMSWENYGYFGWHIDHIIPCTLFDLSDPEQQKICFHHTNTQPLWATKEIAIQYGESENYIGNLEKQGKIIKENADDY